MSNIQNGEELTTGEVALVAGLNSLAISASNEAIQKTGANTFGNVVFSPLTTKGDLYGFSTENARFPAGPSGYALISNPLSVYGLDWRAVGTGSVTTVSVTTNQGVSGTVLNDSTTPDITLSLGALTGVTSINGLVITANTGAITTGTWSATTIAVGKGGTGLTTIAPLSVWVANALDTVVTVTPGAGQSIRINGAGNAWEAFTPGAVVPTAITVADEAADTTCFIAFFTAATGDLGPKTNTNLIYNSNTNAVSITGSLQVDNLNIDLNTISSTAGTDLLITPLAGQQLILDNTIIIDAGVVEGITSLGVTGNRVTAGFFVDLTVTNAITGSVTGNAGTLTVANEATDTSCFIGFYTAASGSLAGKTNVNMTFDSSTGIATFASTVLTTTDINGGTIDNNIIGGSTAAAITGTTITANTSLRILEGGGAPSKYTIFQGGDQSIDLTYTLPTGYPGVTGYVLSSTDAGVMSWIAATSSVTLALEEDGNGDLQPITGTPSGDLSYELDASSDIQPKEYFYDNLGGNIMTGEDNWQIPSDSLIVCVADENLAAGTPVGISNIESGLKVARAMRPSGTSITLPWTMENGTEIKQSSNIAIGGNKFAFVSSQAANDTLYVTIGEVNTSTKTITLGDPIPVTGDFANSAEYVSICRLDTDKLIVFYREDASTTIVKYRVGTVGGLGISFGAADTFFTGGTAANQIAADQISTDKGIVFVSCSTPTDCKLICFTTSGSVATAGTPLSIGTTIDDNIGGSVVKKIGTDKFMLAVGTAAASSNMCQVGTVIGGTTITLGAETVWSTADTIYQKMTILSPATDVAIVCGQNSSQIPVLNACTVSGTTPTFGTEITTGNQYDAYMYAESATSILQTNGGNEFIRRYTLSGNTLTSAGIVFDRMTSSVPYSILAMDNGYWIAFEAFSLNFNYGIQGMSNNYIGFTQNPAEKGGSVYVLTAGIDSNQTGLIPGGTYSIISGVLTFITSTTTMNTADDWFTCALSDTQIRVNR